MRTRPPSFCVFVALAISALAWPAGAAEGDVADETLVAVRAENNVMIGASRQHIALNETIVLTPEKPAASLERPGRKNYVNLLISPLWIKDGASLRPAFQMLKPYLNVSHGRVRRFVLVRPDGETVTTLAAMTPDCAWVLTLELGHVIPRRLTVNVHLSSSSGINPDTEFTYTASNDGQAFRSGPPESYFTILRVNPDMALGPWAVVRDEQALARASAYTVKLERNVNHTIQFGTKAAARM